MMKTKKRGLLIKDIKIVEKRASLNNIKKGWDEEKIYGPICAFLLLIYIILFFFEVISLSILLVAFIILSYTFFVYFPYHKSLVSIYTIFILAVPLVITGFFSMFYGKVIFANIKYLSYFWWLGLIICFSIEFLACKKHKIEEVDIFLSYFKSKFGTWIVPTLVFLSALAFFMFAGTYFIFGWQHVYLWLPILFFWVIAGIRLIKSKILK